MSILFVFLRNQSLLLIGRIGFFVTLQSNIHVMKDLRISLQHIFCT